MRTILFAAILSLHGVVAQAQGAPTLYHGACDGSAAAALDDHHFVAANDDENSLRLYRIGVTNPASAIASTGSARTPATAAATRRTRAIASLPPTSARWRGRRRSS